MAATLPAWAGKVVGMTGGALWGALLVASVFGPFWAVMAIKGWPSDPTAWEAAWGSALAWSVGATSVYCGASCWAVLDWARYNAEIKVERKAYAEANAQLAARVPVFVRALSATLQKHAPGETVSGENYAPATALCAPVCPPPPDSPDD